MERLHPCAHYIDGDSGRVYYEYDAETKTRHQVAAPQEPARPPRFGRHHERHWMEVDEEKEARPVLSPDGKSEAWIEGHNVVMHAAGQPYSEKRVLSQDGTIGCYYSNQLLWSFHTKWEEDCEVTQPMKNGNYSAPHFPFL